MSSQFENIAEISRLLWEGKKEEASNEVRAERARFKAIIENANKNLAMLDAISPPETAPHKAPPPPAKDFVLATEARIQAVADKDKRDSAIIDTAKRLGRESQSFQSATIAAELKNEGVQMGVEDNRANTVISRLLLRHDKVFEKVATGVYRLRNA